MQFPKKECVHIVNVLEESKTALQNLSPLKLRHLSNQTIHDSCTFQDKGTITIAVLLYALSKIIERSDYKRFHSWDKFVKKFLSIIDLSIIAIKEKKFKEYEKYIIKARKTLESESISLKPYIKDILNNAALNKASKLHEHGLSQEQTANLLEISHWDITNYIGGKIKDEKHSLTINTKQRAKEALEFFTK
jgi:hypothetical protein